MKEDDVVGDRREVVVVAGERAGRGNGDGVDGDVGEEVVERGDDAGDELTHLSADVLEYVFLWLDDLSDLLRCSAVCYLWRRVILGTDELWQRLLMRSMYFMREHVRPLDEYPLPESIRRWCGTATARHLGLVRDTKRIENNWKLGRCSITRFPIEPSAATTLIIHKEHVYVGTAGGEVLVYDKQTMRCARVLAEAEDEITALATATEGGISHLITASEDGLVRVYRLDRWEVTSLVAHDAGLVSLRVHENQIVSGDDRGMLKISDLSTGTCLASAVAHQAEINGLACVDDRIFSASWDGHLKMWAMVPAATMHASRNEAKLVPLEDHHAHPEGVFALAYSQKHVITGGGDSHVCVICAHTGALTHRLVGHTAEVYCVDVDGDTIASGDAQSEVFVWSAASGRCLHRLQGHVGVVRHVQLNGHRLITGGDHRRLIVWDAPSGRRVHVVYRQPILLKAFLAEGNQIFVLGTDSPGSLVVVDYSTHDTKKHRA